MKKVFFAIRLLLIGVVIIGSGTAFYKLPATISAAEKQDIISCGNSSTEMVKNDDGKFMNVLPGWGQHKFTISTKNDSTQFYFNQGINFYYGYHFREALASFKEAARLDPACAMTYWGQALAMGPYYNDYYYKMKKGVPEVIKSMNNNKATATENEKALILAMQQRYSTDTTNADRKQLDENYAGEMALLARLPTSNEDIKALYIDAVMLEHKWDFWNNDGTPKRWTPEVIKYCEEILSKNPNHPAALHYYIHLTEASKHPEQALHSADVLKDVMPGVSHLVHMSTHMYQRNGLFTKAVVVNEEANTVNNKVDSLAPNLGIGRDKLIHIFAVQANCAMTAGMFSKGLPIYDRVRRKVVELKVPLEKETYLQYLYMIPVFAHVRLGKWQLILESHAVPGSWKYASVLDNFARGLAYVRNNNIDSAKGCLARLEQNLADSLLAVRLMPFNKPVHCSKIAAGILKGELLFVQGKVNEGIGLLKQAVEQEDQLIYREPQDWPIPARQYLGALLLKVKKSTEAEEVYKQDLIANPGNGWALLGMYNSLVAQDKTADAAAFKTKYLQAFTAADEVPVASAY